jgi:hypothetical protein
MLAGCGGSQPPIGVPGAMPQTSALAMHAGRGTSWMLPGAKNEDLIYATGGCGGTCVLSYPEGKLVGSLNVGATAGACADTSGNVYIANQNTVLEFAHGGTTPINTFTVSGGTDAACSVDSTTGNVAVVIYFSSSYDVAVFSSPSAPPTTYRVTDGAQFCGYDVEGNLFVDSHNPNIVLSELQKGGGGFMPVSIDIIQKAPGQLQWDGKYLALEGIGITHGATIYQLKISGSSATVVHTTKFKGMTEAARQSWIEGNRILIPFGTRGNGPFVTKIGVWKYPRGGKPLQIFKQFAEGLNLQGVTFSPASS